LVGPVTDFLQIVSAGRGNEQGAQVTAATLEATAWPVAEPRAGLVALAERVRHGLGKRRNWLQLLKFSAVGGSGYIVNLAVYAFALEEGLHFRAAAIASFLVAVLNNYTLNRLWTFRDARGHLAYQGMRFFGVSAIVLVTNIAVLSALVALGMGKLPAQAIAIVLVMPLNFVGNKLWTFNR
jgi:dolichol-phosphate mannosyltransferase